jgi:glycosyltransferase involved in cell wall biosynthesis
VRIAQVAHLFEPIPSRLYGGTERVVAWLTEELVSLGHDVTLFASGDSQTTAKLHPVIPRAIRLDSTIGDWSHLYVRLLETVRQQAATFDMLHFHIDSYPFPLFSRQDTPFLSTLHGRLDLQEYQSTFGMFPNVPLISVSDAQRTPLPCLRWIRTIHHGLPPGLLTPLPAKPGYLAFLGRISPEKGIASAIRISKEAGVNLKIAAKIDRADADYFKSVVEPLIDGSTVEYIGEISDGQKSEFLSSACALVFPIDWPEPFGLVMIEAMACGTPVIAFGRSSVPEVVRDGVTGFIVGDERAAAKAVGKVDRLDRAQIRAEFEARFTARRMADDYLEAYEAVILQTQNGRPPG